MNESLPEPLMPAECDLSDFASMFFDVRRLLNSETWIEAAEHPRLGHALMCLWMESWHQIPAASLPDNDSVLARFSMCDLKTWKKLRDLTMKGWVKCSDGRFYHPVVAEKALEAWIEKLVQRRKSGAGNAKRWNIEFDSGQIDAGIEHAAEILRGLNPQSRVFNKRGALIIGKESKSDPTGNPKAIPQGLQQGSQETGTGTGTGKDLRADAPPPPGPPSEPSPSASASKLGTRLPEDWVLPKPWGDWAQTEKSHWSKDFIRSLADRFRDHWIAKSGKDARKADWEATWRNWVRNEKDPSQPRKPAPQAQPNLTWVPPELRGTVHDPNYSGVIIDAEH